MSDKMSCNTARADVSLMENSVKEMKFDIQKAPLGKLSQSQIDRGFQILKKIEIKINGRSKDGPSLEKLSSQYYTHIPHDFGFRFWFLKSMPHVSIIR